MASTKKYKRFIEYIGVVILTIIITMVLVKFFGGYLRDTITKMSCSISNRKYIKSTAIGQSYCEGDNIVNNS